MNSCLDIVLTGISFSIADEIISLIKEESLLLENILSCYNPNSETFQINHNAYTQSVSVSDRLLLIIKECYEFNKMTNGYFDISLKNIKENNIQYPNFSDFGMNNIILDIKNSTIKFLSKNVALDFGAIGKGLLLREVVKILDRFEIKNCFISFGGSSILTRGSHPHGNYWPLSFRNVEDNKIVFQLNNHSVSFSGGLAEGNEKKAFHIVNPMRLKIAETSRISFVQCACPVMSEVLSTILILTAIEEARTIIELINPQKAIIFDKKENQKQAIIYSYDQTN